MAERAPVWTQEALQGNPHADAEKARKVRSMFAAIARSYDLNNRLHSFLQDQRWRRAAVRAAGVTPTTRVLDVACGTGDLAEAFADAGAATVTGVDFTPEMLDVARHKGSARPARSRVRYEQGDAMQLAFPDGSFDVVSIAFGIRNVAVPERALREFFRVLLEPVLRELRVAHTEFGRGLDHLPLLIEELVELRPVLLLEVLAILGSGQTGVTVGGDDHIRVVVTRVFIRRKVGSARLVLGDGHGVSPCRVSRGQAAFWGANAGHL